MTLPESTIRAALHIPPATFTSFLSDPVELVRHAIQCPADAGRRVGLSFSPASPPRFAFFYHIDDRGGYGPTPGAAVLDYLNRYAPTPEETA